MSVLLLTMISTLHFQSSRWIHLVIAGSTATLTSSLTMLCYYSGAVVGQRRSPTAW